MTCTLIITTYNWAEALELSVKSALNQTVLPNEIIIADDGSTFETKELLEKIAKESKIKIIHSWQEDEGFRLAKSRNLAISKASSNYIIIVDGDMLLDKNFIADHLRCANAGYYIQGSRVILSKKLSSKILTNKQSLKPTILNKEITNKINLLRIPLLSKIFCQKSTQKLHGVRGCNFAFFKNDCIKINGFNEDFTTWGREDSEFVQRFYNLGIKRKKLKFSGIQYHLYHKEGNANSCNDQILKKTIEKKLTWCENGIDKHLKSNHVV
ncbi:MAG: Putative two-domain glycosyltransferase [uncultured Sulfurovum sp.]|uniref:Two-domain glycosyltransferase n=1 Tax=uncultured Sulfurovum sp. TaxID=269237 RepID=A0A6S6TUV2_9BACT|nr:MAG: Putative two-domain glycosyltransferase [uncultured Sulfurovum sp.]